MKYWISSLKMTVFVEVNDQGVINNAASIVKVFVGQKLSNLVGWMNRQGGLEIKELKD